ncbi:hypothetical protein EJB05_02523, partial [Eragrostis curvula]
NLISFRGINRVPDIQGEERLQQNIFNQGKNTGQLAYTPNTSYRSRALKGPNSRIGTGLESAIAKAIRDAATRGEKPVFYSAMGTVFNSCQEAWDFYNLYSWEIGFGIRYGRSRTNDNEYMTKMNIVCSCEGRPEHEDSNSIRTQCKAMIRLLRTKDHGWYITKFVGDHNHPLSESYGENKQWPSHGHIDSRTKDFIRKLRENNVSIGRVCSILGVTDGSSTIRKEVVRSVCAKLAQENIKDDIEKTQQLLEEMKTKDPLMDVRLKVNKEGRIKSMLWSTGKNKLDYKSFGNVVTFDTTYRTNLYNMPFGLFVGVNNHFQSTVFGGVLLTSETTKDFEWAFSQFLSIMGGKAPVTILTDQCAAMEAAAKTTIPSARHRWCRWHVLKKAKEYLGHVYSKYNTFKKEFHHLITYVTSRRRFELGWISLLHQYNLGGNRYLKRLFRKRAKWAKPYFMGVFCAGMTSTQRSESANHMLKKYIPRAAPMHLFVRKFSEFQYDRQDQEDKEKHLTKLKQKATHFNVPIEKHAKEVYTRTMLGHFLRELYESGAYAIADTSVDGKFILVHTSEDNDPAACKTEVKLAADKKRISCKCGLYEHMGMLCHHQLKVLVHLDQRSIPEHNLMKRWTKAASTSGVGMTTGAAPNHGTEEARRSLLVKMAMELATTRDIPDEEYTSLMEAMEKARSASRDKSNTHNSKIQTMGLDKPGISLQCPLRPAKKGRPQSTSLRSWQQGVKRRRNIRTGDKSMDRLLSEDEKNPRGGRTRSVQELL